MTMSISRDLEGFHRFIGEKLNRGSAELSPEEVLDEWRVMNPAPEEIAESVAAIRRAAADMHAGDSGRPAAEILAEIRQRIANGLQA